MKNVKKAKIGLIRQVHGIELLKSAENLKLNAVFISAAEPPKGLTENR